MEKCKVIISGTSVMELEGIDGAEKMSLKATSIILDINGLDRKYYFGKDGLPTALGAKGLTQAFIQGLVANIKTAHKEKFWDESGHIRYIISELERGFVSDAHVEKGYQEIPKFPKDRIG